MMKGCTRYRKEGFHGRVWQSIVVIFIGGEVRLGACFQPRAKSPSVADVAMHDYWHVARQIPDGIVGGATAIFPSLCTNMEMFLAPS